jgi:hypothetical protein
MKKIFEKNKMYEARMLSFSKSRYIEKNKYNKIIFNSNIFILKDNKPEKIWYGDLDITKEGNILKKISKELNEILYVTRELDGRFGKENTINLIEKSIWNTNEKTPKVTKKKIRKIKKKEKEEKERNKEIKKRKEKEDKEENKKYKIKNIENNFDKKIKIPYKILKKEYEKIKEMKKDKNEERDNGKIYKKYFKNYGYFTYSILDKYLRKKYKLKKEEEIDPTSVWISIETNKKLKEIDLKVERLFNENFKNKDFGREVTCNYCIEPINYLNMNKMNKKSYKDDIMYIKEEKMKRKIINF